MMERDTQQWYDRAKCAGKDPEAYTVPKSIGRVWSAGGGPSLNRVTERAGKCDGCPVARECARDALDTDDNGMIRGGIQVPSDDTSALHAVRVAALGALSAVANGSAPEVARRAMLSMIPRPANNGGEGQK